MTPARSVSRFFAAAILMSSAVFAQSAGERFQAWPNTAAPLITTDPATGRRVNMRQNNEAYYDMPVASTPKQPAYQGPATVSLNELRHEVPAKAAKELDKGARAVSEDRLDAAVEHFTKAIKMDPEFVAARNDLAACLIRQGKASSAIDTLMPVTSKLQGNSLSYANLAVAYIMKNEQGAAERAARRSLDLDRTGTRAKLILGMTLVLGDRFGEETENLLRKAEPDFPQAHLLLGRALAGRGDLEGAKAKMVQYLRSGDESGREMAEEWLNTINRYTERKAAAVR